jgi:uncharacterized protein (TIGR00251 family)
MIDVHETAGSVTFMVRVQPRASSNEISGEWDGALRVRLTAPPVDNSANEALRRLLAKRLKLPVAAVRIVRGERGRTKQLEVRGATALQIHRLSPGYRPP